MYHGIINVYKEAGYTSHDVVAKLRGICRQKKIGHTGTLDPDAVGVLPVCLGNATKLCDMLTDRQKEYIATLQLGISTDTQDGSGKVLARREVSASPSEVRDVILSFVGDSMQVPPMYSALKVNGKKLYELAREGKEVERAARPITIYELEILEEAHPEYIIKVKCSKGTYIRTLCHDIGEKLGCGGVMVKLIRSKAGGFEIETARTLDQLQYLSDQGTLSEAVIPVEKMFEAYPAFSVKESAFKAIQNGNQLKRNDFVEETADMIDGQKMRVYSHQNIFYGVYQCDRKRELFLPVKMFFS
ncbi:MAG: tRNA pseudouridine(55) synthase TruB [Lachnospiraceae bacterium]|nr:tRNA pseudouridine(55) synthase TruB [Lachnospiraceae bacterium]GFI02206.1 tRNA pseudouridine synthase B [Lachnospiraceae bacterium]